MQAKYENNQFIKFPAPMKEYVEPEEGEEEEVDERPFHEKQEEVSKILEKMKLMDKSKDKENTNPSVEE